jgi:hypothetical protein
MVAGSPQNERAGRLPQRELPYGKQTVTGTAATSYVDLKTREHWRDVKLLSAALLEARHQLR